MEGQIVDKQGNKQVLAFFAHARHAFKKPLGWTKVTRAVVTGDGQPLEIQCTAQAPLYCVVRSVHMLRCWLLAAA